MFYFSILLCWQLLLFFGVKSKWDFKPGENHCGCFWVSKRQDRQMKRVWNFRTKKTQDSFDQWSFQLAIYKWYMSGVYTANGVII